ncbi:type VI secretion system Vgr family protein [Caballeronia sp. S22]|uniref:type VI secretion system Vgr family protein n=1 Tax=Caballeronia sp. S22 TaxID=3137182 RepID=UPI0035307B7E
MPKPTHTRTLGLRCSALPASDYWGMPYLVPLRLRGSEAIGELFEYTLTAQTRDIYSDAFPEAACLDLDKLLNAEATVTIEIPGKWQFIAGQPGHTGAGNVGRHTREITGIVAQARIVGGNGRSIIYEFVIRPALYLATLNQASRAFFGLSVIEITREVMQGYGISVDYRIGGPGGGKAHYPKREYQRQAFESDYNFLRRLWEEWGIAFWFEHTDGFHQLVLSDGPGAFQPHGPAHETLRYHPSKERIDEEFIDTLSITNVLSTGAVALRDHDYTAPSWGRAGNRASGMEEVSANPRELNHARSEIYDWGGFAQPAELGLSRKPNEPLEEARHLARVRMDAIRCKTHRAKGHGPLSGLLSGHTFALTGYPQRNANTDYLVVSCTLNIQEVDTEAKESDPFRCDADFEIEPLSEYHRLEQKTPRPRIYGPEAAVIVGYEDAEQWLDALGRYLVQFRWDREGEFDEKRAIWLRVALPWQGNARGVAMPLRIGDEVIVSYVNGDPDLPIIAGSVTNKWNVPAWNLPKNASLAGIRTRSLGHEAGTNHLALDDTKGQLQAQLSSDQGSSILSLGFIRRIFGNEGRREPRGQGFELRTDLWGVLRAGLGMLITTEGRANATGHAKEMSETVGRLTQARDIHESMAELAQRHGAQGASGNQSDVARSIKTANDELRGTGTANVHTGEFPEFVAPHLTLASPAGIQTTTTGSTHIASDKDLAVTTGRHISFAAARSMFASVLESFAVFAQKAGIALTTAAGKVRIEAQSDGVQIVARKDVEIVSADGWINLTAAKGVRINGGGSVIEISPQGLRGFTGGEFRVHAASHATDAPLEKPVRMPLTDIEDAKVAEHFVLIEHRSGFRLPAQPYRITLDDGAVIKGTTNARGETSLVLSAAVQFATVEILHDDGTENPLGISRAALTQNSDVAYPLPLTMEKRVQRFGSKNAEKNQNEPTSLGRYASLATCSPNNWGMRYSVAHDVQTGKLAYPVASEYAEAIHQCLLDKVKWGDGYFGKDEKKVKIELAWPISPDSAREMSSLIASVLYDALTSSLGGFALPETALPSIKFESFRVSVDNRNISNSQGGFTAARWDLCINTDRLDDIFKGDMKDVGARSLRLKGVRTLAMTLYHETRHCQQSFWMYALVQTQPENFCGQLGKENKTLPDLPNIKFWPNEEAINAAAKQVVKITARQSVPENIAALISIKRMAVSYYWFYLGFNRQNDSRPGFLTNEAAMAEELAKAREFTTDLMKNTGLGGTAVDIDDMAVGSVRRNVDYSGRPWEDDAFFSEEVAGCYWDHVDVSGELVLPEPDVCSPKFVTDSRASEYIARTNTGQEHSERAK